MPNRVPLVKNKIQVTISTRQSYRQMRHNPHAVVLNPILASSGIDPSHLGFKSSSSSSASTITSVFHSPDAATSRPSCAIRAISLILII